MSEISGKSFHGLINFAKRTCYDKSALGAGKTVYIGYKGVYRGMIEMVYKGNDGNGKGEKKLPKNVRQIGEAGRGKKVYLEDYAVTYLHQVEAAVLLGECWEKDGSQYIFINGAIRIDDPQFGDGIWEEVYRDAREYFEDSEILGWALQVSEQPPAPDQKMNRIFKAHFDREDTVLLLHDPTEKEDAVFTEENGTLKKSGGYYVYYDKNKSMQEYMICKNAGKSVEKEAEITDKAIKNFRIKAEKKLDTHGKEKETGKQPKNFRLLYAASTFLAFLVIIIGVTMVNNYDKMKNMELAISNMTRGTDAALRTNAQVEEEQKENDLTEKEQGTGEKDRFTKESRSDVPKTDTVQTENLSTSENRIVKESVTDHAQASGAGSTEDAAASGVTGTEDAAASGVNSTKDTLPAGVDDIALREQEEDVSKEAAVSGVRTQQAYYTIKAGDTLVDICRMYYGSDERLEELCAVNGITDPNRILPGQKIKLPVGE